MVELERLHAELVLENAESRRSRAEMDYSQVGLPRFLDQNEISQPLNGRMTTLEATMAELERVHAECATFQVQFMELTRANVQIQPTPFKSVKEEMAPMTTSCTQLTFEKEQPKQEESMSIQELVVKYMKEQENMTTMSFTGQHESFPSTLGVNTEEENLSYNEEITLSGNEELKKFQTVENDTKILETLVVKEDEPTYLESHEKINDKVVTTIPEMGPWGEMYENLKKEKMTPIPKTEECTIKLFKEMEATIVNKKNEKNKK